VQPISGIYQRIDVQTLIVRLYVRHACLGYGAYCTVDFLAVCLVRAIVDGGGNDCVGNTALPLVFSCAEMHAAHVGFRRFGKSGARNRYYCIVTIHV